MKNKTEKPKLEQIWNGYCPESYLKGKNVRMRLNQSDFFESEETKLQIAVYCTQAIILNFRGEGKFSLISKFADEIANSQMLSPQNIANPPFNQPVDIFMDSDEIDTYIQSIK